MTADPGPSDSPETAVPAKALRRHRRRASALADQEDDINDVGIALEQALVSAASEAALEASTEANERMRRAAEALQAVDALLEAVQGREGAPTVVRMAEHAEVVRDAVAVLQRAAATSRGAAPHQGDETRKLAERAVRATGALAEALGALAGPPLALDPDTIGSADPPDGPPLHTIEDPMESVRALGEFAPEWFEIAAVSLVNGDRPSREAVERLRRALRVLQRSRDLYRAFEAETALPEEEPPREFADVHSDAMGHMVDSLERLVAMTAEDAEATGSAGTRLESALATLGALEDLLSSVERPAARRARMQPHRRALLEAERVLEKATASAAAARMDEPDSERARRYFRMTTQASRALRTLTRELQAEWEETGDVDDVQDEVEAPVDFERDTSDGGSA